MKTQNTGHKTQIKHKFQNTKPKHICVLNSLGSGFCLCFVKSVFCDFRSREHANGYAAITTTILALVVSITVVGGLTLFTLREVNINRVFIKSIESRAISESGIEDAVYRVLTGKQISNLETLVVGNGTSTISITNIGSQKIIRSEGKKGNLQQNIQTQIDSTADGVGFFYGVQVGAGGLSMGNNSRVNGNVYSNGSIIGNNGAIITGDATVAGASNRIEDMIIGTATTGVARASQFVNTSVHGSNCPNAYCIVENPATQNLPIPPEVIQEWRDAASAGGTCVQPQCDASGNFKITNGASASLGPKKITGNLEVDNNATLTVTGTIWVLGDIKLSNGCIVRLSSSYGSLSGVVMTDAKADISNNCTFQGSGAVGSYPMVLSAKNSPAEGVINVDNNSQGVIYYASNGRIKFSNNATAKEATGYGITLDNNATITYESGLANSQFSSGPSGGLEIQHWKEVE